MYAREIGGAEHTFGVSGKLIMNALVMYDHQTGTLWSQFLGQGVKDPQIGVMLESVPVTHTRWSAWRETHPDTLVLDKGDATRATATPRTTVAAARAFWVRPAKTSGCTTSRWSWE